MFERHAGAGQTRSRHLVGDAGRQLHGTEDLLELFAAHAAGSQDRRGRLRQVDDGGFDTHRRWAGIQNQVHTIAQIFGDVLGARRAGSAKAIGARGGNGLDCGLQQGGGDGMPRHPQSYCGPAGGHFVGNLRGLLDDEGQRPRPEAADEQFELRQEPLHERMRHRQVADMDNERVPIRPILCGKNLADRLRVEGERSESVNSLGGEGDETSGAKDLRGAFDGVALRCMGIDFDDILHSRGAASVSDAGNTEKSFREGLELCIVLREVVIYDVLMRKFLPCPAKKFRGWWTICCGAGFILLTYAFTYHGSSGHGSDELILRLYTTRQLEIAQAHRGYNV